MIFNVVRCHSIKKLNSQFREDLFTKIQHLNCLNICISQHLPKSIISYTGSDSGSAISDRKWDTDQRWAGSSWVTQAIAFLTRASRVEFVALDAVLVRLSSLALSIFATALLWFKLKFLKTKNNYFWRFNNFLWLYLI